MPEAAQRISVRIYYEDTDFSGRVYHASYLRFFERGRTEWLRAFGFEHASLMQSHGLAFAVTDLQLQFHAPAFIDDQLEVVTELTPPRGARLLFRQNLFRTGALLVSGEIAVVTIKDNRATRPPRELLGALQAVTRR